MRIPQTAVLYWLMLTASEHSQAFTTRTRTTTTSRTLLTTSSPLAHQHASSVRSSPAALFLQPDQEDAGVRGGGLVFLSSFELQMKRIYEDWKALHGKEEEEFNEHRFQAFCQNYVKVKRVHDLSTVKARMAAESTSRRGPAEDEPPADLLSLLNEYTDYTKEEYIKLRKEQEKSKPEESKSTKESRKTSSKTSGKSKDKKNESKTKAAASDSVAMEERAVSPKKTKSKPSPSKERAESTVLSKEVPSAKAEGSTRSKTSKSQRPLSVDVRGSFGARDEPSSAMTSPAALSVISKSKEKVTPKVVEAAKSESKKDSTEEQVSPPKTSKSHRPLSVDIRGSFTARDEPSSAMTSPAALSFTSKSKEKVTPKVVESAKSESKKDSTEEKLSPPKTSTSHRPLSVDSRGSFTARDAPSSAVTSPAALSFTSKSKEKTTPKAVEAAQESKVSTAEKKLTPPKTSKSQRPLLADSRGSFTSRDAPSSSVTSAAAQSFASKGKDTGTTPKALPVSESKDSTEENVTPPKSSKSQRPLSVDSRGSFSGRDTPSSSVTSAAAESFASKTKDDTPPKALAASESKDSTEEKSAPPKTSKSQRPLSVDSRGSFTGRDAPSSSVTSVAAQSRASKGADPGTTKKVAKSKTKGSKENKSTDAEEETPSPSKETVAQIQPQTAVSRPPVAANRQNHFTIDSSSATQTSKPAPATKSTTSQPPAFSQNNISVKVPPRPKPVRALPVAPTEESTDNKMKERIPPPAFTQNNISVKVPARPKPVRALPVPKPVAEKSTRTEETGLARASKSSLPPPASKQQPAPLPPAFSQTNFSLKSKRPPPSKAGAVAVPSDQSSSALEVDFPIQRGPTPDVPQLKAAPKATKVADSKEKKEIVEPKQPTPAKAENDEDREVVETEQSAEESEPKQTDSPKMVLGTDKKSRQLAMASNESRYSTDRDPKTAFKASGTNEPGTKSEQRPLASNESQFSTDRSPSKSFGARGTNEAKPEQRPLPSNESQFSTDKSPSASFRAPNGNNANTEQRPLLSNESQFSTDKSPSISFRAPSESSKGEAEQRPLASNESQFSTDRSPSKSFGARDANKQKSEQRPLTSNESQFSTDRSPSKSFGAKGANQQKAEQRPLASNESQFSTDRSPSKSFGAKGANQQKSEQRPLASNESQFSTDRSPTKSFRARSESDENRAEQRPIPSNESQFSTDRSPSTSFVAPDPDKKTEQRPLPSNEGRFAGMPPAPRSFTAPVYGGEEQVASDSELELETAHGEEEQVASDSEPELEPVEDEEDVNIAEVSMDADEKAQPSDMDRQQMVEGVFEGKVSVGYRGDEESTQIGSTNEDPSVIPPSNPLSMEQVLQGEMDMFEKMKTQTDALAESNTGENSATPATRPEEEMLQSLKAKSEASGLSDAELLLQGKLPSKSSKDREEDVEFSSKALDEILQGEMESFKEMKDNFGSEDSAAPKQSTSERLDEAVSGLSNIGDILEAEMKAAKELQATDAAAANPLQADDVTVNGNDAENQVTAKAISNKERKGENKRKKKGKTKK